MSEWRLAESAPEGRAIMTKLDDGKGERNVQALVRKDKLWWIVDGTMYVYYNPTHWRELTPAERDKELLNLADTVHVQKAQIERAKATLS